MKISQITRRDIFDAMTAEGVDWAGRLDGPAFLSRLFDLQSLPSTDHRYNDAAGDIWKHTVANDDWDYDWIFHDSRFNLLGGDDLPPVAVPTDWQEVRLQG